MTSVTAGWMRQKANTCILAWAMAAAALATVLPVLGYVACVSSQTECSFAITCREYDDRTHEDLGIIFEIDFYTC